MNVQETFDTIVAIASEPSFYRSIEAENVWVQYPMMRNNDVVRTITIRKAGENRIVYEEKTETRPHYEEVMTVDTNTIVLAFAGNGSVDVTNCMTTVYERINNSSITHNGSASETSIHYEEISNNDIEKIFEHTVLFKDGLYID